MEGLPTISQSYTPEDPVQRSQGDWPPHDDALAGSQGSPAALLGAAPRHAPDQGKMSWSDAHSRPKYKIPVKEQRLEAAPGRIVWKSIGAPQKETADKEYKTVLRPRVTRYAKAA